ncbi:hypothetical protein [Actinokineospora xionganensis]|uniref:Uncharacterized protein n=1 Tax=Actinokineospora xionganensis TaxID=2684470 RepID=A0ABR7LCV2_9PSEU|nr:hypothetical protein [Actinokineospora xionganensis]MBC6450535.1 hypothetical protein [Actinokineospora xionganensis]
MAVQAGAGGRVGFVAALNGKYHKAAVLGFTVIVIGHWAEHLVQAWQIFVLGWPRPKSLGLIGHYIPWLFTSEWMHYGYALVMLIGFVVLRHGFTGRSRTWWVAAMWIQVWHHFEHLLLLVQAMTGQYLLGEPKPTSIIQLIAPRVELHLFYNFVVFVPMVVAMIAHLRPRPEERAEMVCSCAAPVPVG